VAQCFAYLTSIGGLLKIKIVVLFQRKFIMADHAALGVLKQAPYLKLKHDVITREEAQKFLLPGYEMDPYFPKGGVTCGPEHLRYVLQVGYVLLVEYRRVIVGQRAMTTYTLIGMLAVGDRDFDHSGAGHVFYLGLPGTGKSLLAKVPQNVVAAVTARIQGTIDLMPTDITGNYIVQIEKETQQRFFEFKKGPVFSNILLFDEGPRTPARAQSGLLESLSEGTVTVAGVTHGGADPFMIMTGNPIESEGQHQMSDALRDRLMFCVLAEPFTARDYTEILRRTRTFNKMKLEPIADYNKVIEAREFFHDTVYVAPQIEDFIGSLAKTINEVDHLGLLQDLRTRTNYSDNDEIIKPGSAILSGRGTPHLEGAARTLAALRYRNYVTLADVHKVLLPVIRHRTHFTANALFHFPEAIRAELKADYAGRAGKTEASEYLLKQIINVAWSHVACTKER
jgi:MoxR-like ATPase